MKKIISMVLAVVLLIGIFPVQTLAADITASGTPPINQEEKLGLESVGTGGYVTMTTSDKMLNILKMVEGFSADPYWDYAQWTVGYGSYAGSKSPNLKPNIRFEHNQEGYDAAEKMLRDQLRSYENAVNNFCRNIGKQPSQNQFDALVDFTYNLGSGWMDGSRLRSWLEHPTTEMELVNAMGQWVRAGGEILFGLVQRRIREAIVFLKGIYYLPGTPQPCHNVKIPMQAVSPAALPLYKSVIVQYDYGSNKGLGNKVIYFAEGGTYDDLPYVERDGYTFDGWLITRENGNRTSKGEFLTKDSVVVKNLEITARWLNPDGSVADGSAPDYNPSDPDTSEPLPESTAKHPFTDVTDESWYSKDVQYVFENEYMYGTSSDEFSPENSMTRAMLVTVLYRMDGSPAVSESAKEVFDDVDRDEYYADAVAWASENGIVYGVSSSEFDPDSNITRQDTVVIFNRFCVDYLQVSKNQSADLSNFHDPDDIAEYAEEAMQWAVSVKMIMGSGDSGALYLNPGDNLSRAENAALLTRLDKEIIG